MSARMSFGLAGALPGDRTLEDQLAHLAEFSALELCFAFYEVIDGRLYVASEGKTELVDPQRPWSGWSPYSWYEPYEYPVWYQAMLEAWQRPGYRGDLTYQEWSDLNVSAFVPNYDGPSKGVRLETLGDSLQVASTETGWALCKELGLPKYLHDALALGQEFAFIVRISG